MNREKRKRFNYEQKHKLIDSILHKQCSTCNEWKPMDDNHFYKWNRSPDGFAAQCCECAKAYGRKRKASNREYFNKIDLKYYYNNKESCTKTTLEYKKKNKDKLRKSYEAWRNSEKGKKIMRFHSRKRRNKNHIIYEMEWIACKNYFNNSCAYCGLPVENHYKVIKGGLRKEDLHKEHVIDDGKNDLSNCIPSCNTCNTSKHQKTLNEFYNSKNPDYTYERYYRIYMWLRYDYKKFIMPKRRFKGQRIDSRLKEVEENKNNTKKNQ